METGNLVENWAIIGRDYRKANQINPISCRTDVLESNNHKLRGLVDHNPRILDSEDHTLRIQDLEDHNLKIQDLEGHNPRTQD